MGTILSSPFYYAVYSATLLYMDSSFLFCFEGGGNCDGIEVVEYIVFKMAFKWVVFSDF
jgi:hypothetical protein